MECSEDPLVFKTFEEMITHFRSTKHVLCCRLTDPCPRSPVVVSEIDRILLSLTQRLSKTEVEDMWAGTWRYGTRSVPVHVRRLHHSLHSKADVAQEVALRRKLLHNNIMQLYGVSTIKAPMYVISESLENGSLLYYMREGLGRQMGLAQKIDFTAQIASGVDYLHSQLCIHRYLCAKNIFVTSKNIAKIANFRYAKLLLGESSVIKLPVEQFHIRWSPPEVLESGDFSLKSDVWSFGVLLTEIFTYGKLPYFDIESRDEVKEKVTKDHYRIPKSHLLGCPDTMYEVMLSCWRSEADVRPHFEFIITGLYDCVPLWTTTETLL